MATSSRNWFAQFLEKMVGDAAVGLILAAINAIALPILYSQRRWLAAIVSPTTIFVLLAACLLLGSVVVYFIYDIHLHHPIRLAEKRESNPDDEFTFTEYSWRSILSSSNDIRVTTRLLRSPQYRCRENEYQDEVMRAFQSSTESKHVLYLTLGATPYYGNSRSAGSETGMLERMVEFSERQGRGQTDVARRKRIVIYDKSLLRSANYASEYRAAVVDTIRLSRKISTTKIISKEELALNHHAELLKDFGIWEFEDGATKKELTFSSARVSRSGLRAQYAQDYRVIGRLANGGERDFFHKLIERFERQFVEVWEADNLKIGYQKEYIYWVKS